MWIVSLNVTTGIELIDFRGELRKLRIIKLHQTGLGLLGANAQLR